ncbi:MAG: SUMF1/EgtB/PvdO family nonheme iron enzyme [Gammaproteobacteria bacterium]|nr:SUMF1/EgtB/PvdO family nonheme iron enzyme [Gammaproteobacteria bacterium]
MPFTTPPVSPTLRIRVFLALPDDITDERALALRVLERLPYDESLLDRIVLETVTWDKPRADTPVPSTTPPEEAISQQRPKPSECDIVIAIFWSRMGTPLPPGYTKPDGSTYLSGTEWEYFDAVHGSHQAGRPIILLYRRTEAPCIALDDPLFQEKELQWQSVQTFFASLTNPEKPMPPEIHEYAAPDAFESILTWHLRESVQMLLSDHASDSSIMAPGLRRERPHWRGSPFPGLRALSKQDAAIYFGRGKETEELIHSLAAGTRFIAVVGTYGTGKSSLVAAGILPQLRDNAISGSRDWIQVQFTPGGLGPNPYLALAAGFKPVLNRHNRTLHEQAHIFETDPDALKELVGMMLRDQPKWSELLCFVDQLEELFTVVDEKHRTGFSRLLARAANLPGIRIVATLRADFYQNCVEQQVLAELLRNGSYPLAAPGIDALYEMITRPASRVGLCFEEQLVEHILEDTGTEPGALPLMAFALEKLYEKRNEGELTQSAYDTFGGVRGAISQYAEDTFLTLDRHIQTTLESVFHELVEVDPTEGGWVATRRRVLQDKVAPTPESQALVSAFLKARLLVQDRGPENKPVVEIAHEALLHNWPRLVEWIQKTGGSLTMLPRLPPGNRDSVTQVPDTAPHWLQQRLRLAEDTLERLKADVNESAHALLTADHDTTWRQTTMVVMGIVLFLVFTGFSVFTYTVADGNPKYAAGMLWERVLYEMGASGLKNWEPRMVHIPPKGLPMPFPMGSQEGNKDEQPVHSVQITRPFAIGKYEVTFEEYQYFTDKTGSLLPGDRGWGHGRQPVIAISWEQAQRYITWLSVVTGKTYRLPTESEWEYAARAGTDTRFWWGDDINQNGKIWANCDGCGSQWDNLQTAPVGSFEENPFGLHDTAGNVWEWVQDCWHRDYHKSPPTNGAAWTEKADGDCKRRVLRGGSWYDFPRFLRPANRSSYGIGIRNHALGFRVALDLY